jgi:hypothetical protein
MQAETLTAAARAELGRRFRGWWTAFAILWLIPGGALLMFLFRPFVMLVRNGPRTVGVDPDAWHDAIILIHMDVVVIGAAMALVLWVLPLTVALFAWYSFRSVLKPTDPEPPPAQAAA